MPGELELLRWIWKRVGGRRGKIVVDSGDDCAVLRIGRKDVLFKIDSVIEGVHFRKRDPLDGVGHKALARPLSDIAAMGGVPTAAIAALVMPCSMTQREARRIYLGMERLRVPIVGGDIASHRGPLSISVAVLGEMGGVKPVLRRGARVHDIIAVTGRRLGGSLENGRHLRFKPRLREGRLLATRYHAHAMIDISDGLVRDVAHLCEASGLGAMLTERLIGTTDVNAALYDGEDYELLVALRRPDALRAAKAGLVRWLGAFTRAPGIQLYGRDGVRRSLVVRGWEHPLG